MSVPSGSAALSPIRLPVDIPLSASPTFSGLSSPVVVSSRDEPVDGGATYVPSRRVGEIELRETLTGEVPSGEVGTVQENAALPAHSGRPDSASELDRAFLGESHAEGEATIVEERRDNPSPPLRPRTPSPGPSTPIVEANRSPSEFYTPSAPYEVLHPPRRSRSPSPSSSDEVVCPKAKRPLGFVSEGQQGRLSRNHGTGEVDAVAAVHAPKPSTHKAEHGGTVETATYIVDAGSGSIPIIRVDPAPPCGVELIQPDLATNREQLRMKIKTTGRRNRALSANPEYPHARVGKALESIENQSTSVKGETTSNPKSLNLPDRDGRGRFLKKSNPKGGSQ